MGLVFTVGGLNAVAALLAAAKAPLFHQPGDTLAPVTASLLTQLLDYTRAAVCLAALFVDRLDDDGQSLVCDSTRPRAIGTLLPHVVAAGSNIEVLVKGLDRMVGFHRVDPFAPVMGGSERMPNVFLMARCSRRWRFSPLRRVLKILRELNC